MTGAPTQQERIDAIRAVRLAAHELANVCAAIVGGTQMAIALPVADTIGQTTRGLTPKPLDKSGGEQ